MMRGSDRNVPHTGQRMAAAAARTTAPGGVGLASARAGACSAAAAAGSHCLPCAPAQVKIRLNNPGRAPDCSRQLDSIAVHAWWCVAHITSHDSTLPELTISLKQHYPRGKNSEATTWWGTAPELPAAAMVPVGGVPGPAC